MPYATSMVTTRPIIPSEIPRSSIGHILHDEPIAHVVAGQRRKSGERQLAAAVTRRSVGRRDELDAQEGLFRLAPHELAARDGALEIVEQRVEPSDVARVHPVGGDGLALEGPGAAATRGALLQRDLDVVVLDADPTALAMQRVDDLADAGVPRQVRGRRAGRKAQPAGEVVLGVE